MKKVALTAALAASLGVSACATNPYGYGYNDPYQNDQARRAATGAAIGGAAAQDQVKTAIFFVSQLFWR